MLCFCSWFPVDVQMVPEAIGAGPFPPLCKRGPGPGREQPLSISPRTRHIFDWARTLVRAGRFARREKARKDGERRFARRHEDLVLYCLRSTTKKIFACLDFL